MLLLQLLKTRDNDSSSSPPLEVQVQVLQLLHVLLPEWVGSANQQQEVLKKLLEILTDAVLLTNYDDVLDLAHSKNLLAQGTKSVVLFVCRF